MMRLQRLTAGTGKNDRFQKGSGPVFQKKDLDAKFVSTGRKLLDFHQVSRPSKFKQHHPDAWKLSHGPLELAGGGG